MTFFDTFALILVALVLGYRSLLAPQRAGLGRKLIFFANGRAAYGGLVAALLIGGFALVDERPIHLLTGLVVGVGVAALLDLPEERARHRDLVS